MHFIKRYKKVLLVAPIACMLSGGIFSLPNATIAHAQEIQKPGLMKPDNSLSQEDHYTKENLAQIAAARFSYAADKIPSLREKFKLKPNESFYHGYSSHTTLYIEETLRKNLQLSAEGLINVTPHVDSYTDLGQTNLLTYNNDDGIVEQKASTPETTITESETFSYSNTEGIKLGAEMESKVTFNIPFTAAGETKVTAKSEFSYEHDDTKTKTHEKEVTFKSQEIVAAPGGTTTYYGSVKTANFSGSFQSDTVVGGVTLTLPIGVLDKDGHPKQTHTETATLTAEDMYEIFKAPMPWDLYKLPPYLKLDDSGKRVLLTEKATFDIKGQGGFYTEIQAKFVPKDKNKKTRIMPYAEYVQKIKQNAL